MQVNVEDQIRNNPELAAKVDAATNLLEAEVGRSREPVTAEWSFKENGSARPILSLTISDFSGSVNARFSLEELSDAFHVQGRLLRLWGDLLQIRSHKQLEKLREVVQQLED